MHPLRIIKRFFDKILGTKSDELFWKYRHFSDKNWAKSYIDNLSLSHPHRKILINIISEFYPFENILEIGSASGPNLFLLAEKFFKVNFTGVDVSKKAVDEGKRFFELKGIKNVSLQVSNILGLKEIGSKSMDIVFSDASLLYIGTEEIYLVFEEMFRIAKKSIILCEQNTDSKSFYDDKWVHNYKEIINKVSPQAKISFTKIPENIWTGDWGKYGYIIEVVFKNEEIVTKN